MKHGHKAAESRVELLEYEISQRSEEMLMNMFEPSLSLKLLNPVESVFRQAFHKSSSMPSLTLLAGRSSNVDLQKNLKDFCSSTSTLNGQLFPVVKVSPESVKSVPQNTTVVTCKLQQVSIDDLALNEIGMSC